MFNMTDKKYFKIMLFNIAGLFVLTVFSVIYCVIKTSSVEEIQRTSHIMSIVYLMLQLVMEGAAFYYAFRAMVKGSTLIKPIMYAKDNVVNPKSKRNALITFIVSCDIAIFFLITLFPIEVLSFFSLGLRFALLNCGLLIAVVSLFFFCYVRKREVQ